jgi:hypothetical protein
MAMTSLGVATTVSAQTPSSVDTFRVADAQAAPGDTVEIEFFITNVDTLGAYAVRLRFDPALVEPLTDTVYDGNDTLYVTEVEQLRGTAFEQFGGGVPEPNIMTMAAVDFDVDTLDLFLPGSGPAVRMHWRVLPAAIPQTTAIVFENDPLFPNSHNTITDLWGDIFKRPILVNGIFTIEGTDCSCPFQADYDLDGFITVLDLGVCIDILFASDPDIQDAVCPTTRFDYDCDGFTTTLDLGDMIDYIFASGPGPCDPCAR